MTAPRITRRQLLGAVLAGAVPGWATANTTGVKAALVIGNAHYKVGVLKNPLNDAMAVGGALRKLGFDVSQHTDTTLAQMIDALDNHHFPEFQSLHNRLVRAIGRPEDHIPDGGLLLGVDDVDLVALADRLVGALGLARPAVDAFLGDVGRHAVFLAPAWASPAGETAGV